MARRVQAGLRLVRSLRSIQVLIQVSINSSIIVSIRITLLPGKRS